MIHAGASVNRIYGNGEQNLVVVARWLDREAYDEFVEWVMGRWSRQARVEEGIVVSVVEGRIDPFTLLDV